MEIEGLIKDITKANVDSNQIIYQTKNTRNEKNSLELEEFGDLTQSDVKPDEDADKVANVI